VAASLLPLALLAADLRIDTRAVPVSVIGSREEGTMYRQRPAQSRALTLVELEDAQDLRSVIAEALAATPVDDESLRRAVWTYVRAEHHLGTPPGSVIVALTELVDASTIGPPMVRQPVMRQVILWSVEAYFGYLGGEVVGGGNHVPSRQSVAPGPIIVSNR
jgi:hypothetical protein